MKTIEFTSQSTLVKYLAFLNNDNFPYKYTLYRISWREDSCSLIQHVIFRTVLVAALLLFILAASLFLGAGFWASLYVLIFIPELYLLALSGAGWIEISAVLVNAAAAIMSLFGLAILLAKYGPKFLDKIVETSFFLFFSPITKPLASGFKKLGKARESFRESSTYELYRSWKEKYCAKIKVNWDN